MTMIDRESAEKLTQGLRDGTIPPAILAHSLLLMLDKGLGREENRVPSYKPSELEDRLVSFFNVVMTVEPPQPEPYTVAEVGALARHSQSSYLERADGAPRALKGLYRSIARDYADLAAVAESGLLISALKSYDRLDTADRENFGWGAEGWDEGRWAATRKLAHKDQVLVD